jgi:hypothetical protein
MDGCMVGGWSEFMDIWTHAWIYMDGCMDGGWIGTERQMGGVIIVGPYIHSSCNIVGNYD